MIYNDECGTILNLYQQHQLNSQGHTRHNKVDRPEMDDDDKAAEDEQNAIIEAVKLDNEMRKRTARRQRVRDKKITEKDSIPSTDNIGLIVQENGAPLMYLIGQADEDMLATWIEFCRKTQERIQTRYFDDGELNMYCVTRFNTYMHLNSEWTAYYLRNNKLYELETWVLMDRRHEIQKMSDLPDGAMALVYDVECSRSQQAMRDWECSEDRYVIPLSLTPFPYGCVVTRRNEIYDIVKL